MRVLAAVVLMGTALPLWAQLFFVDKKADNQPDINFMRGAFDTAISPDGKHIYVPGSLDHGLTVLSMNKFTGKLSLVAEYVDGQGGIDSLTGIRSAEVSPDGKHVYTAALTDSAVTVFSRNETSGELTLVEVIEDQVRGSAVGLGGAMDVAVSPDGEHVYVAARSDSAVTAFTRNSTSGALTFIDVYQNNAPPVVHMDSPESLTLSPDGRHLYVSALGSHAVVAFERDEITGELTYVAAYRDGFGGVDGLGCTNNLAVSPDGGHLYAVGQFGAPGTFCSTGWDDWMGIFSRNAATGELSFIATMSPNSFNLPINCSGVVADNGVVVSPNGESVFATLQTKGAILDLERNPNSGLLTLRGFECADLFDPNSIFDLNSAHRVITDPMGMRVLVTTLSPGTLVAYDTADYNAYRQAIGLWPDPVDVTDLLDMLSAFFGRRTQDP
ncbi:MAG: beta-propeller fold lactonase family protein [Acidobacteriota bacterium]|nr:beta-propeller fold lactonase family protein [Acidobacteriota bacterium]